MTALEHCIHTQFEEDDDDVLTPFRHLKIVRLHQDSNGRSCSMHQCCGRVVVVGDILWIKKTVVDISSNRFEEALLLTLVTHGKESCRVAFIPRFLLGTTLVQKNINKFMQVVELVGESSNTAKQQKDRQLGGVAGCAFIDEIPSLV